MKSQFLLLLSSIVLLGLIVLPTQSSQTVKTEGWTAQSFRGASQASVRQFYELSSFSVLANDEHIEHFHVDHVHKFKTLDVNGIPEFNHRPSTLGKTKGRYYQPFPDRVNMHLKAFDVQYSLDLQLLPELFNEKSKVTVVDENGMEVSTNITVSTYHAPLDNDGWATVSLRTDGRFYATIHSGDMVLEAAPVDALANEMEESVYTEAARSVTRGMLVFRHNDLMNQHRKKCGNDHVHGGRAHENHDHKHDADDHHDDTHSLSSPSQFSNQSSIISDPVQSSRRLLQVNYPTTASELQLSPLSCVSLPYSRISIGVAVDAGFYQLFGSNLNDIQTHVSYLIATANVIYQRQLNLTMTLGELLVYTTTGGSTPSWNKAPSNTRSACSNSDITSTLSAFSSWRQTARNAQQATWHLLTNCFPSGSGTYVGMSYVGTTCYHNSDGGAVSSYNIPFWLTFAHETGHTFGASHTFQNGQGSTGGLMDYSDGRYPIGSGPFMFHPVYNARTPDGLCTSVNRLASMPSCAISLSNTCGNGIIEPGEDCDDNSNCCDHRTCKFAIGAQCSGNSTCCNSNTCKYNPSTTTCAAGQGYCSNGDCLLTACPTSMTLCSITRNGCRQGCATSAGVCTDAYRNYPLNMADGTVCNQSPYSECVNSVCTAISITYSWRTSNPTACNCSGLATREVSCFGSDGVRYANSYCPSPVPSTTVSCTAPTVGCVSYVWSAGNWGSCNVDCGSGTKSRSVTCVREGTTTAAPSTTYCTGQTMPETTTPCSASSQCPLYLVTSPDSGYFPCTASCGGGTQVRYNTCWMVQNGITSEALLSDCNARYGTNARFEEYVSCNTQSCVTYAWRYSDWGSCNATCGGGIKTRTATCYSSTNLVVSNSLCTGTPELTTSCNTQACGSYRYLPTQWAGCNATCDGGIQSRILQCYDDISRTYVANSYCANMGLTIPPLVGPCAEIPCAGSVYSWYTLVWGTCSSTSCGTQTRQVTCRDSQLRTVSEMFCLYSSAKPERSQSCGSTCASNSGRLLVNEESTALYTTSISGWLTTDWSECSVNCGNGLRTRTVKCESESCDESVRPENTTACFESQCKQYWFASTWSICSGSCGGGIKTRSVRCLSIETNEVLPDSACQGPRPTTQAECNYFACPSWKASEWSNCSAQCGDGLRSRTIQCEAYDGTVLDDSVCADQIPPSSVTSCYLMPCPHWNRADWNECSRPCGSGNQTRELKCRMPYGEPYYGSIVDDALCPSTGNAGYVGDGIGEAGVPFGRPIDTRACNVHECPTYFWWTHPVSECSALCGGGEQDVNVLCHRSVDDAIVDDSLCGDAKPSAVRACNTQSCPSYQWGAVSEWSNCSSICGKGVQTRDIACLSSENERVNVAECELYAQPESTRECSLPINVCHSTESHVVTGYCNVDAGSCVCRQGWSGLYCEIAPQIENVLTNAVDYPYGITVDDVITVTWESSTNMKYVSVLLIQQQDDLWPYAQYLEQRVLNLGSYIWRISSSSLGLSSGSGYQIRVWYDDQTYADSASFVINDPCLYTSCGAHGQCSSGLCTCDAGWSGEQCDISPCDKAGCNWAHATCNNENYNAASSNASLCECKDDWSGARCRSPPICAAEPICQNGADYIQSSFDENGNAIECGACQCVNNFVGEQCETCGLQCNNGGVPSSDCSTCECAANSGYYGPSCSCPYFELQNTLRMPDVDFAREAVTLARFEKTFASDIATAISTFSISKTNIHVTSVQINTFLIHLTNNFDSALVNTALNNIVSSSSRYYNVTVTYWLSKQCSTLSSFDSASVQDMHSGVSINGISTSAEGNIILPNIHDTIELIDIYTATSNAFANVDHVVYKGVITNYLAKDVALIARDPSNTYNLSPNVVPENPFIAPPNTGNDKHDKDDDNDNVFSSISLPIIVAVTGVVAVALIVVSIYVYRRFRSTRSSVGVNMPKSFSPVHDNDTTAKIELPIIRIFTGDDEVVDHYLASRGQPAMSPTFASSQTGFQALH